MQYSYFSVHLYRLSGTPRPPFVDLIQRLVSLQNQKELNIKSPVVASIDIPSGWHVEEGDMAGDGLKPDMLVCFYRNLHFEQILKKY